MKMRLLVPDGTINYVKNPSFRYDTAGWNNFGGVLTRSVERARFGISSGKIVAPGSAINEGAYYRINWLNGISDVITASAYVRGAGKVQIRLVDNNFLTYTSQAVRITDDRWYRLEVTGRCGGGTDVRIYIETSDTSPQAVTFYVDGAQLERKTYASTYCDGDQDGCMWNVYQHGSLSTRSPYTRAGGRWINLVGCDREEKDLYATIIGGLGVANIRNNIQSFADAPGSFYQGYKVEDRVITIAFHTRNANKNDSQSLRKLHALRKTLFEIIRPDRTKGGDELVLEYQDGDFPVYVKVRYDGGMEGEWDIRNGYYQSFPVRFLAVSPFIFDDSYETASLNFRERININYMAQRFDGAWQGMNYGMNGEVYELAVGKRGEIVAVGNFSRSNWNASAVSPQIYTNYVAYWDGTQWNQLGTGADGIINDAAIAPNGDIYVVGNFTNIGGVAANRAARWNGTAWSALGTGLNAAGLAVKVAPNGHVYVGGSFTTAGGVVAKYIGYWDGGTWHGISATGGVNNTVRTIAISADGDSIFFGGDFTDEFGTTGNYTFGRVAMYLFSLDEFFELGVGFNDVVRKVALSPSGRLYACGDFTESSDSANAYLYIAYWNGAAWYGLGIGADDTVRNIDINSLGHVLAVGDFTRIGSETARGIGFWNGSTWVNLDIETGANSYSAKFDSAGNVYLATASLNADIASVTNINVLGTAETNPIIYITGPATLRWIENQTTKRRIYANLGILNGEEVFFNFGTGKVTSTTRGDLAYAILPGSDLRSWTLIPGENRIAALMTDDVNATMRIYYSPRYWSADAMADEEGL